MRISCSTRTSMSVRVCAQSQSGQETQTGSRHARWPLNTAYSARSWTDNFSCNAPTHSTYYSFEWHDSSMHRYIVILFRRYVSRCLFCNHNFFFCVHFFSFRQKRYLIISTCYFRKVIPQIHNYFVKIFYEILISRN